MTRSTNHPSTFGEARQDHHLVDEQNALQHPVDRSRVASLSSGLFNPSSLSFLASRELTLLLPITRNASLASPTTKLQSLSVASFSNASSSLRSCPSRPLFSPASLPRYLPLLSSVQRPRDLRHRQGYHPCPRSSQPQGCGRSRRSGLARHAVRTRNEDGPAQRLRRGRGQDLQGLAH